MDLLDILHYYFEDDMAPSTAEQQDARTNARRTLYEEIYKYGTYGWVPRESRGAIADGGAIGPPMDDAVAEPRALTSKPYVPPTEMSPTAARPFGSVLDPPVG